MFSYGIVFPALNNFTSFFFLLRRATIHLYSGQSNHRAEQTKAGGEHLGTGMPPVPHAGLEMK